MRPVAVIELLHNILEPDELTTIVDVGANPFNGTPPYAVLRRSRKCKVIGFEPQSNALEALLGSARENETYLPYAVGDGSIETFYITKNSGLVSIFPIEPWVKHYLNHWWERATKVQ